MYLNIFINLLTSAVAGASCFLLIVSENLVFSLVILIFLVSPLCFLLLGQNLLANFDLIYLLTFGLLGVLAIIEKEKELSSSIDRMLAFFLTGFLIFALCYPSFLFFLLVAYVCLFSFVFLQLTFGSTDNSNLSWYEKVKLRLYAIYFDPKYLSLINFWQESFPCRIKKGNGHIFWEVLSLVLLSLSTILHTRYRLLIPLYFGRCFLYGHPEWWLFYFIPVLSLTALVYLPVYRTYIIGIYGETIFKKLGWNTGILQSGIGIKTAVAITATWTAGTAGDNFISQRYVNPSDFDQACKQYHINLKHWQEACLAAGESSSTFANKPIYPDWEEFKNRRLRHDLPGAKAIQPWLDLETPSTKTDTGAEKSKVWPPKWKGWPPKIK